MSIITLDNPIEIKRAKYKKDGWKTNLDKPIILKEDIYSKKFFVNTNYFREAALHYLKYGKYTLAPEGSKEYNEYWDEQDRRCLHGYKVGDLWITGKHYFYLNFVRINKAPDKEYLKYNPKASPTTKVNTFPSFWGIDLSWWYTKELVEQNALNMIPECHIAVVKTRRAGFSFKEACEGVYNYNFIPYSKSLYYAATETYLTTDGIFNKVDAMLNYLNDSTDWYKNRQVKNTFKHKRASYIDPELGIEKGYKSELIAQVLDNPNKARGGDAIKVTFEEGGSFPNLLEAWDISLPQVQQSGLVTGFMTVFGTGGDENEGDLEGLSEIFYKPSAYECIAFNNIWDEGMEGTECGFFCPTTWINHLAMDDNGNLDEELALRKANEIRSRREKGKNIKKNKAENPLCPSEALVKVNSTLFPTDLIRKQRLKIESSGTIQSLIKHGRIFKEEGVYRFKPTNDEPLTDYPIKLDGKPKNSAISILQLPYRDSTNHVPEDMYFIVHDPYYKDGTSDTSPSVGATYVFKRDNNIDKKKPNDCIVAWYVARPSTKDKYNENLFSLAEFYNASIQFEAQGGGESVFEYAKRKHFTHRLYFEPDMLHNRELEKKGNKSYGTVMNDKRKQLFLGYFADWLIKERGYNEDGYILNLHKIYDIGLLKELENYKNDGNFDRVSACILGAMMTLELEAIEIEDRKSNSSIFTRKLFTDNTYNNSNNSNTKYLQS